ncbi:MAG: phage virion morphogenesis protein [Prevotellaceae bacterium]|jgi:phage gpG-like protein|nr:phage virion morphogenesis protein [Prevotellaceae bacterium]
MTPEEFQQHLKTLSVRFKDTFSRYAPTAIGKIAVSLFKQNFQTEGFFGERWKEVKRRQDGKNFKTITRGERKGETRAVNAWGRRKILTGATGDLGRSIEYKVEGNGTVMIFTNPSIFGKEPYARVHNEGLHAGRGGGFTMTKRQFIGDHPALRAEIINELNRKLIEITNK